LDIGAGTLSDCRGLPQPAFKTEVCRSAAAIRYVLQDKRIHLLTISMRLRQEVDANIKILTGDTTYTLDDRALLAEFCAKALDSDPIKAMRVD